MPEESNSLIGSFQDIVNLLERKWSFQIIYEIGNYKKIRFTALQEKLITISPKTLSDTLKKLENEDLICKKLFNQMPPKVEYSLTKNGLSLHSIVVNLLKWSLSRKEFKDQDDLDSSKPQTLHKLETTIILINNNESENMLFQSLLEHLGCKVVGLGSDAKDAIRLYKQYTPNVTFVDVRMHEYDGFDAIKSIHEVNPDAKIIVSTADSSDETKGLSEDLKVSSILHKPYSIATLEHMLKTDLNIQVTKTKK